MEERINALERRVAELEKLLEKAAPPPPDPVPPPPPTPAVIQFKTSDDKTIDILEKYICKSEYFSAFLTRWTSGGSTDVVSTECDYDTMRRVHDLLMNPFVSKDWEQAADDAAYFGIDIYATPYLWLTTGQFTTTCCGKGTSFLSPIYNQDFIVWLDSWRSNISVLSIESGKIRTAVSINVCDELLIADAKPLACVVDSTSIMLISLDNCIRSKFVTDFSVTDIQFCDADTALVFRDKYTDTWHKMVNLETGEVVSATEPYPTRTAPPTGGPPKGGEKWTGFQPHGLRLRVEDRLYDDSVGGKFVGLNVDDDIARVWYAGHDTVLVATRANTMYLLQSQLSLTLN